MQYVVFILGRALTADDVRDAPNFEEVWKSGILPFGGGLPLAAHNAVFDIGVVKAALEWYGQPILPLKYFCTLELARTAWPKLKSHALSSLGKHFDIVYEARNALEDAQTCGLIVCKAAEKYACDNPRKLFRAARIRLYSFRHKNITRQNSARN
jgi:DNA polymerase-3 subunit epsilon